MNALAYHPEKGVVDLVGGLEDIANGIVRCVGDPDRRFQEDALRMLRALRFASVLEMKIEEKTAEAIHRNRQLLQYIAAERVQAELTKLLCGPGVADILRDFADVIAAPLPELVPMFGFEQHNFHHDKDVWAHTIAVVTNIRPEPMLRWAALLHDVGKPSCFSVGEDGVGHFYGHAAQSTAMAGDILARLRFDNACRERIMRLIRFHDLPLTSDRKTVKRLLNKHGVDAARQLIELHRADTLGLAAVYWSRLAELEQVDAVMDDILREEACFSLKDLAVNGNDLTAMGLRGREVGLALQKCLGAVMDDRVPNERDALLALVQGMA
jgi:tRNA nucleotidyltransferase (CCA-adding enzyme)